MKVLIKHIDTIIGGSLIKDRDILFSEIIEKVERGGTIVPDASMQVIDCEHSDNILASGYIDIHTHGAKGHDCMEATEESLEAISRFHLLNGTTTFLPTTLTAPLEAIRKVIESVRTYEKNNPYARIYGIHLEGPFISPDGAGAQPKAYIVAPDEYNTNFILDASDVVKRVTVAPDVKGITEFTKAASEHSIQVSAGHDNCIHPEVEACVKEGLSSVTHLFNCTSRAARRGGIEKYLGLTETALVREDLVAEIIGDGVHVPYGLIYLTYKNKGTKGMCIVSDSLAVSGINTSPLYLGKEGEGYLVELKEGVCCIAGTNTLAGSVTPISKMVENIVKNTSIPLVDCLVMSTLTPSRLLNMKDRGDVKVGYVADMNIVSPTGKIVNTIFKGRII